MSFPAVSVIIPAYNNAQTLGAAVSSALAQTLRDIEVIVVDDCSHDRTWSIAQMHARSDTRVKVLRTERNLGGAGARNIAIETARGAWIALLDADDLYQPQRLQRLVDAAERTGADLICDELQLLDVGLGCVVESTQYARGRLHKLTAAFLFENDTPLKRHALGYVKPVFRRALLEHTGVRYKIDHTIGHDFIFLTELLLNGANALILPEAMYVYSERWGPVSRALSPHARVSGSSSLVLQGCDHLLKKYGDVMSGEERRLLLRRRVLLERRELYSTAKTAFREGKVAQGLSTILLNPQIWQLSAKTIATRIYYSWIARRMQLDKAGRTQRALR